MEILINESLKAYIDPLTPDEYEALETSILAEGCRDALVLWGSVLIDGHNRYGICRKHDLPFQTVQNTRFQSMDDVHLWMIDQHLGRRSVSDFQRGVLALRKREILAARRALAEEQRAQAEAAAPEPEPAPAVADASDQDADGAPPWSSDAPAGTTVFDSREALAKAARLSSNQVGLIEKIQKQATPEVVAAVKSGAISINAAAAVATLPAEEQRAAAMAGGDELKQAAKRARESKRKPREPKANDAASAGDDAELQALRQRVEELTAENEALRREIAELQAALA
ncbi:MULTISPECIES: plasmid replication/partition related protein [unclassified Lysobacter]|uniref:plasmid replication/partition related protein n=1 Tax=unclassified Lysobacter TaxID=2635362 RepID=UPI001BE646E6|nr:MULTISPECIES: plasmid replication/partition related protein [unclassified Lysobacter]MBT2746625.1 plasmid replication/partition related protein [Lysobacter sp. ISL-42]MBT2753380.1 plasmid replication/partition related protein [Lysobacter sp. ISL-50]MBT2775490.1 plasmid replication/partition related protein [Lysobacter sp. ISL-54]MBT2782974.1 plasmid replication/partition related protein [Lysobacter sp. ISL-52]